MLQKKICMLGSFAVGKTSLVKRYVEGIFSESYITTLGVKIDRKQLTVDDVDLSLIVWDVYGEDTHQNVLPEYLRGMAGYILVVDPTRPNTFETAQRLHSLVDSTVGNVPFIYVRNKSDLKDQWHVENEEQGVLENFAFATVNTSAKEDIGVEEVFSRLGEGILNSANTSKR